MVCQFEVTLAWMSTSRLKPVLLKNYNFHTKLLAYVYQVEHIAPCWVQYMFKLNHSVRIQIVNLTTFFSTTPLWVLRDSESGSH